MLEVLEGEKVGFRGNAGITRLMTLNMDTDMSEEFKEGEKRIKEVEEFV